MNGLNVIRFVFIWPTKQQFFLTPYNSSNLDPRFLDSSVTNKYPVKILPEKIFSLYKVFQI